MLKFLKIFVPAGTGVASVLAIAYVAADQFVIDVPAPIREMVEVEPAMAQEAAPAAAAAAPITTLTAELSPAPSMAGGYGLGREAMAEEIAKFSNKVEAAAFIKFCNWVVSEVYTCRRGSLAYDIA